MSPRRILVLVPHPDDEVVGCAAAIARRRAAGAAVFALYLTTGIPAPELLWRWDRRRHARLVARRQAEARAAAALLGLEPVGFAARPARTLKDDVGAARASIATALRNLAADWLWTPAYEGGHQDHDVCNYLARGFADRIAIDEFAEYNFAGGSVRSQAFPRVTGGERVLHLGAAERSAKAKALAVYRSERRNLGHVRLEREVMRPLAEHDYTRPPHDGTLFWTRFHWVPFRHPRIDFTSPAEVRATLTRAPVG